MNDLPFVRKGGQPITAILWNQLCAAVRANRLIAGNGVRLREMPDGTIITFDGGSAEFVHPFQVSLVRHRGGHDPAGHRESRGRENQRRAARRVRCRTGGATAGASASASQCSMTKAAATSASR